MKDSLKVQSELALEFIIRTWPGVRSAAETGLAPIADRISNVIITGCGDSHHAAVSLELAFSTWSGLNVRAAPAMEAARYLSPRLVGSNGEVLFIGISVSGEVARTIEAVELAGSSGARTLALTGNIGSSLGQASQLRIGVPVPEVPPGPGLLNFLGSLLMGFAVARVLSGQAERAEIDRCLDEFPGVFEPWLAEEIDRGEAFSKRTGGDQPVVFLGSGPAYGMAMFAAAKLVEAAGVPAWGQDVEEWAHIEYFAQPANLPTWLLSSGGRSLSREEEVASAARAIERDWTLSRWPGHPRWKRDMREALSPLCLWTGPVGYASRIAASLDETAFRGFGGGRSTEEGGGASRIRSSRRLQSLSDLQE